MKRTIMTVVIFSLCFTMIFVGKSFASKGKYEDPQVHLRFDPADLYANSGVGEYTITGNVESVPGTGLPHSGGINFDGPDKTITISGENPLSEHSFTLAFWVKTDTGNGGLINVGYYKHFYIQLNNGFIEYYHREWDNNGLRVDLISDTPIPDDGEWHHITAVCNIEEDRVTLYLDRKIVGEWTGADLWGPQDNTPEINLGFARSGGPSDPGFRYNEDMGPVRIYDRPIYFENVQEPPVVYWETETVVQGQEAPFKVEAPIKDEGEAKIVVVNAHNISEKYFLDAVIFFDGTAAGAWDTTGKPLGEYDLYAYKSPTKYVKSDNVLTVVEEASDDPILLSAYWGNTVINVGDRAVMNITGSKCNGEPFYLELYDENDVLVDVFYGTFANDTFASVDWPNAAPSGSYYFRAVLTNYSEQRQTSNTLSVLEPSTDYHYIRAGANGNGSSWVNALPELPSSLQRGHTYYIADGNYGDYDFDDPYDAQNPLYIYIKKATIEDHGPDDVTWDDSYGDGEAVFDSTIEFRQSYYIFDGQKRNPDWKSGYGFVIDATDGDRGIRLSYRDVSYITVKNTEIAGCGDDGNSQANDLIYATKGEEGLIFSKLYLHDAGRCPFLIRGGGGVDKPVIEYCYVARNESTSTQHSEGISAAWITSWIVRHNIWEDIEGTGVIVFYGDHWEIYGNVIYYTDDATTNPRISNGSITTWTDPLDGNVNNSVIYNNTFVNLKGLDAGLDFNSASYANKAYNNIFYNCETVNHSKVDHDYNAYAAIGSGNYDDNPEPNGDYDFDPNLFMNRDNYNYQLIGATQPGKDDLGPPYHVDMFGTIRGEDGLWDRGAFEYETIR